MLKTETVDSGDDFRWFWILDKSKRFRAFKLQMSFLRRMIAGNCLILHSNAVYVMVEKNKRKSHGLLSINDLSMWTSHSHGESYNFPQKTYLVRAVLQLSTRAPRTVKMIKIYILILLSFDLQTVKEIWVLLTFARCVDKSNETFPILFKFVFSVKSAYQLVRIFQLVLRLER